MQTIDLRIYLLDQANATRYKRILIILGEVNLRAEINVIIIIN